ncbi:DoxX family protein [Flavobacterium cyanobacteriorum]|uniref:DoxX family protein n=1 Tax=Flavobacterium cyanobacteriorum TaxID=2022802 RepID=A0A255YSB5_9FLAO|nr:DoxX family protein [Flavobacterium cyanobacteriorum]OYQ32081.1 DoxX family protein [Flavobacterium cyanobacteriorum]
MARLFFNIKKLNFDVAMLLFRVAVSVQLIVVHGLKKIGVGTGIAETVPNPFGLPEALNQYFAIASNLVFPLFVIIGLFTRLACLPVLAVTLSGYFVVHWNDPLLVKDVPFMYSLCFLFIAAVGGGRYSVDAYFEGRRK